MKYLNREPLLYILREVNQLDWRTTNRKVERPFSIGLIGTSDEIALLKKDLMSFPHYTAKFFEELLPELANFSLEHATPSWVELPLTGKSSWHELDAQQMRVLQPCLFCLALEEGSFSGGRADGLFYWPYDKDIKAKRKLISFLLDTYEEYAYALAFRFPLFRCLMIEREIKRTAMQNTSWVMASSLPNFVPGPHQLVTMPLEATSDFVVLTLNELKMMLSLSALAGIRIEPLKSWPQLSLVLGMAKLAQISATQLVSKVPAGGGVLIKGAVAYAFSRAMGEAIFISLITGRSQGLHFFKTRMKAWMDEGQRVARNFIGKRRP